MKRRIRLTESDLHNIVKESVKRILREGFYGGTPSFIIKSISINGNDVTNEFFESFGDEFESKYDFSSNLNSFLEKYGITAFDVDTANDFGESGDEIYVNTNSDDEIEVHGGYEDLIDNTTDDEYIEL